MRGVVGVPGETEGMGILFSQSTEITSSPKEGIRNMQMEMMREQYTERRWEMPFSLINKPSTNYEGVSPAYNISCVECMVGP